MLRKIAHSFRPLIRHAGYDLVRFPQPSPLHFERIRHWLSTLKINTAIDVGANAGQFAQVTRNIWPNAAIFSFEPIAATYESLVVSTKEMHNIHTFHCALGESDGTLTMNKNGFSPSSSLLPMKKDLKETFRFVADTTPETVAIRRLDDVLAPFVLNDDIFLKIDVQGYELHVLKGGLKTLARCNIVMLETSFKSMYDGQPRFHDIYTFMREHGFAFSGNFDQLLSPVNGAIVEADALFVREHPPSQP